jgi:hypothetical protein
MASPACFAGDLARKPVQCYEPRGKEPRMTYFRHHRQRGPVQALQMRLQG